MNSTVAFVANRAQYEIIRRAAPDTRIASGDFEVLSALQRSGVPPVDLWRFLGEAAFENNRERAWVFCRRMAEILSGRFVFGKCDVLERCKFELFWSLHAVLNVTTSARSLFREMQIGEAVHFSEMTTPDFFNLPSGPADLFNACVADAAEKANIPCRPLRLPQAEEKPRLFTPVSETAAVNTQIRRMGENIGVICFSEQLGTDEQELLCTRAAQTQSDSWLVVSGEGPRSALPYLSMRHARWLPFSTGEFEKTAHRFAQDAVPLLAREIGGEYPEIFENPKLGFVWNAFGGLLVGAASEYARAAFMADAVAPRAVVMGSDVTGPARCFVRGFADHGVPVVAIDHVGLGWEMDNRWNTDTETHLAVWGEFDESGRRSVKGSRCMVAAVGSLRRAHRDAEHAETSPGFKNRKPRIVIFTSQTGAGTTLSGWCAPADLRDAWSEIIRALRELGDCEVLIKPHPRYDHPEFYKTEVARLLPGSRVVNEPAAEAVRDASVAILMNTPSTVIVEIIAAGVPVLYFKRNVMACAGSAVETDGAPVCADGAELLKLLREITGSPDAALRLRGAQRDFLRRTLAATGNAAEDNTMAFLDKIGSLAVPPESPDPAARWIVALLALLDRLRLGGMTMTEFEHELHELSGHGRGLDFHRIETLDAARLGEVFLRVVTWGEWRGPKNFRPRLLWKLHRALPQSIRPSWPLAREHFAETLDQSRRESTLPRASRRLAQAALCVIAPGRLLRKKIA